MNLRFSGLTDSQMVNRFKIIWILVSVIACVYFSFYAFPKALNSDSPEDVTLNFSVIDVVGDQETSTRYFPNRGHWRERYLSGAQEKEYLFVSLCDMIPQYQRPNCDPSDNWISIPISDLGCTSLEDCEVSSLTILAHDREDFLTGVKTLDGSAMPGTADPPFSFENPNSWGVLAPFLMFLLTFFLSIKSGRTVGEFLFKPYLEK